MDPEVEEMRREIRRLRIIIGLLEMIGQRQQMPLPSRDPFLMISEVEEAGRYIDANIIDMMAHFGISRLAELVSYSRRELGQLLSNSEIEQVVSFLASQRLFLLGEDGTRRFPTSLVPLAKNG